MAATGLDRRGQEARFRLTGTWTGSDSEGAAVTFAFLSESEVVIRPLDPVRYLRRFSVRVPGLPQLAFRRVRRYSRRDSTLLLHPISLVPGLRAKEATLKVLSANHLRLTIADIGYELRRLVGAEQKACRVIREARRLFLEGKHPAALGRFEEADLLRPSEDALAGMGFCYLAMKSDAHAYRVFDGFLYYYPASRNRQLIHAIAVRIASGLNAAVLDRILGEPR